MDFARAVVRRLEERDWCDLGIGLVGYACGSTSPKYHGHRCYGPFHAPLQQDCCVMLEFQARKLSDTHLRSASSANLPGIRISFAPTRNPHLLRTQHGSVHLMRTHPGSVHLMCTSRAGSAHICLRSGRTTESTPVPARRTEPTRTLWTSARSSSPGRATWA